MAATPTEHTPAEMIEWLHSMSKAIAGERGKNRPCRFLRCAELLEIHCPPQIPTTGDPDA